MLGVGWDLGSLVSPSLSSQEGEWEAAVTCDSVALPAAWGPGGNGAGAGLAPALSLGHIPSVVSQGHISHHSSL